jgi:hypothetical protein
MDLFYVRAGNERYDGKLSANMPITNFNVQLLQDSVTQNCLGGYSHWEDFQGCEDWRVVWSSAAGWRERANCFDGDGGQCKITKPGSANRLVYNYLEGLDLPNPLLEKAITQSLREDQNTDFMEVS